MGGRFRCECVSLSGLYQPFFSVGAIIPVSFVVLTVLVGGLLRQGVVDPTIRPGGGETKLSAEGHSFILLCPLLDSAGTP